MTAPRVRARMLATIDGFPYDPSASVLLIRTPRSRLTLDMRLACASASLRSALSAAVAVRLATDLPTCVYQDFIAIAAFLKASASAAGRAVAKLTLGDFCAVTATSPGSFNNLVHGLRRMAPLLGSTMESSLRRELATIRPTMRKRRPGDARRPDDRNGALSKAEYAELAASLADRLVTGEVTAADHALAVLAATLVPRPTQIALLKARDLVQVGWSGGRPCYKLRIARIKQRGKAFASSFRMRDVDPGLGSLLAAQRDRAIREAAAYGIGAEDAPMFMGTVVTSVLGTPFPELRGYLRHMTGSDVTRRVREVLGVNSRCARRTIATMMRADGRSYRQVGWVLDNTPHVAQGYVDDSPEVAARVNARLGAALAPLAALFLGRPGGRVPSLDWRDFRA